jgi:hypothetical protein
MVFADLFKGYCYLMIRCFASLRQWLLEPDALLGRATTPYPEVKTWPSTVATRVCANFVKICKVWANILRNYFTPLRLFKSFVLSFTRSAS